MKNIILTIIAIAVGVLGTANSFADDSSQIDKEVAKEMAVKACMARAIEIYGSATSNVKPRRSRIGRLKGYLV